MKKAERINFTKFVYRGEVYLPVKLEEFAKMLDVADYKSTGKLDSLPDVSLDEIAAILKIAFDREVGKVAEAAKKEIAQLREATMQEMAQMKLCYDKNTAQMTEKNKAWQGVLEGFETRLEKTSERLAAEAEELAKLNEQTVAVVDAIVSVAPVLQEAKKTRKRGLVLYDGGVYWGLRRAARELGLTLRALQRGIEEGRIETTEIHGRKMLAARTVEALREREAKKRKDKERRVLRERQRSSKKSVSSQK